MDPAQYKTTPAEAPLPFEPAKKQRFSKKQKISGGVLIALLVVVLGAFATYAMWWNNDEKVVTDGLMSVLSAEHGTGTGVLSATNDTGLEGSLSLDIAAAEGTSYTDMKLNVKQGGLEFNIDGSVVGDDGSYYLKVNKLKDTVQAFLQGNPQAASMFNPILDKIDGKWIVITPEDLDKLNDSESNDEEFTCIQNAFTALQKNDDQLSEIKDVYKRDENRFIVVKEKLESKTIDGQKSNGYVIELDEKKSDSFGDSLKETKFFAELNKCTEEDLLKDDSPEKANDSSDEQPRIEVWVDSMSHNMTGLTITSDAEDDMEVKIEVTMNFGNKPEVTIPKAGTTIEDLQAEIQKLQSDFTSPGSASSPLASPVVQNGGNDTLLARSQDTERKTEVLAIATQLEAYYNGSGYYPGPKEMSESTILNTLRGLDASYLEAPGSQGFSVVTTSAQGALSPTASQYIYQPLDSTGKPCSRAKDCTEFTLWYKYASTGAVQQKQSLNN